MTRLLLASTSPRRRQLLSEAGYRFTIMAPADDAESGDFTGWGPRDLVAELARRKAVDVVQQLSQQPDTPSAIVLAADTVAECDGRILGKPSDVDQARDMLQWLSGREHQVLTGVCLVHGQLPSDSTTGGAGPEITGPEYIVEVVVTRLLMSPLETNWLEPFLETGGWEGKAGAFGYQDGLRFVRIVEGSESNVVGLPMERVGQLLASVGCFPEPADQS